MRNPVLVTTSHTEPMFAPADFPTALERLVTALYLAAKHQGLTPEGRARVRVLPPKRPEQTIPMLVGSLVSRPPDIPDVDPAVEAWMPLVSALEPTA